MKVNGYSLRTAIKNRETERDAAIASLTNSISGETGPSPEELMNKIEKCEEDIAKLQAFQTRYNLAVTVEFSSEKISMAEAVKRIGGIERVSAQWKSLLNRPLSAVAVSVGRLDSTMAMQRAKQSATLASTLRGRMSAANGTEIEIPELEESLMS